MHWNARIEMLRSDLVQAQVRREYYRIRLAQINQGPLMLEAAE
jgi:hypothetical protein